MMEIFVLDMTLLALHSNEKVANVSWEPGSNTKVDHEHSNCFVNNVLKVFCVLFGCHAVGCLNL